MSYATSHLAPFGSKFYHDLPSLWIQSYLLSTSGWGKISENLEGFFRSFSDSGHGSIDAGHDLTFTLRSYSYGKSPFFMGKLIINSHFP